MPALLPALLDPPDRVALRFGATELTYAQLASAAGALAGELRGRTRVAVYATPSIHTAVGIAAALLAGVTTVPLKDRKSTRLNSSHT